MEDFKTYKPLLSAIKNEYDLYITYLQQQIADMLPLKVIVQIHSGGCYNMKYEKYFVSRLISFL